MFSLRIDLFCSPKWKVFKKFLKIVYMCPLALLEPKDSKNLKNLYGDVKISFKF